MGLLNSLFGKETVQNYKNGQDVSVQVLDPKGSYDTKWKVGEDISIEVVNKFMNPTTNKLYALTIYEAGEPKTSILPHVKWLEVKVAMGE